MVEKIKIIEVQIPYIVYKPKEVIVTAEVSDMNLHINNIESIINRYSTPYEDIYKN